MTINWAKNRNGDLVAKTPEGSFFISDANSSRSGKFEAEFTTADGRARYELGRTKSEEAAKKLAEKKLREVLTVSLHTQGYDSGWYDGKNERPRPRQVYRESPEGYKRGYNEGYNDAENARELAARIELAKRNAP
jgi:hypothetical protein